MLVRYAGMTAKSQSYLFTFGLGLTFLGMAITQLWLPMVVGAIIMCGLAVESWIRVAHLIPMHQEIRELKRQVELLNKASMQRED